VAAFVQHVSVPRLGRVQTHLLVQFYKVVQRVGIVSPEDVQSCFGLLGLLPRRWCEDRSRLWNRRQLEEISESEQVVASHDAEGLIAALPVTATLHGSIRVVLGKGTQKLIW